ncbi:MAG: nicotinate phosphoribosyltransferase, partial [Psychrobacter sp.]
GAWKDIYKDPVTSRSKRSKKGRLALVKDDSGQLTTVKENEMSDPTDNLLRDVYVDGKLLIEDSLTTIRERAGW